MARDVCPEAQKRLQAAYSAAHFETAGHEVVQEIAAFLRRSHNGEGAVLNWREPLDNLQEADGLLDCDPKVTDLVQRIFARGQTIHNPSYIGHQVPPPIPLSALFETVSSISNQGMTIYEMGPWSTAVERVMVERLGRQLGLSEGFGGILTSGGSLANLTALLTARNAALQDAWQKGLGAGLQAGVILAHGESHYCIERAAGVLGIGTDNCIKVPVDHRHKMDVKALEALLQQLQSQNRAVIAVVASACSTRMGTYDPLRRIAAVCQRFGVWFHVDAAHGGAAAFSSQYAHYLDGIELADSVVWDAHKMLFMPALSTYLFYRRSRDQYRACNQLASYLFDANAGRSEAYNTGLGTLECTKRAAAFSLWATWAIHGRQLFTDLVEVTYGMARRYASLMKDHPEFDLLNEPEANIIVFRYRPAQLKNASVREVGAFQDLLRRRLIESGESYIVPASDSGASALRMVVMNPLSTELHFEALVQSLARLSAEVL